MPDLTRTDLTKFDPRQLWIQFSRLSDGGFGRVMWEKDFMDLWKHITSPISTASDLVDCEHCAGTGKLGVPSTDRRQAECGMCQGRGKIART